MRFPDDCNTPAERTEYCYRALELLRLVHNTMGRWFREGLSEAQWSRFPVRLRVRYPYKPQLTEREWRGFVKDVFDPMEGRIAEKLLASREALKQSTRWRVDVEDI